MGKRETAHEIDEAAFRWVARFDRDRDNPQLRSELTAWLAEDSRRKGAYLRAQALWLRLDLASSAASSTESRESGFFTRRQAMAAAAGVVLAAGLGGAWLISRGKNFDTVIGEIRDVPLPDGSSAYLNTQSRVQIAMEESVRRVRLKEGEVWFHVKSDPNRPFIVEVGSVRVRAVGTAFAVKRLDDSSEVLVSEGVVETWISGAEADAVRLGAGEKATLRERAPIQPLLIAPGEVDRRLAWRAGKIDLAGETLGEAVAEFNRYNRRQISIREPSILAKRFYGIFRTDDSEGFVRAVHVSLNVPVEISANGIVIGKPGIQ
jgi:transmembrane sensor